MDCYGPSTKMENTVMITAVGKERTQFKARKGGFDNECSLKLGSQHISTELAKVLAKKDNRTSP